MKTLESAVPFFCQVLKGAFLLALTAMPTVARAAEAPPIRSSRFPRDGSVRILALGRF